MVEVCNCLARFRRDVGIFSSQSCVPPKPALDPLACVGFSSDREHRRHFIRGDDAKFMESRESRLELGLPGFALVSRAFAVPSKRVGRNVSKAPSSQFARIIRAFLHDVASFLTSDLTRVVLLQRIAPLAQTYWRGSNSLKPSRSDWNKACEIQESHVLLA